MLIQTFGFQSKPKPPLGVCPRALFDYSESETGLLQTSPAVNANPTVRTDSNLELVWPKLVSDSCVIKHLYKLTVSYRWHNV